MKSSPCWSGIPYGFRLLVFFSAILSITSNAFGAGGQVTPSPSTINFGSVLVGTSKTQSVTLTNSGAYKLNITQISLSGTGFILSGLTRSVALAVGQSVTGQVIFAPPSSGADSGTVSISFTTQNRKYGALIKNKVNLPLSGTGTTTTGQLTIAPTSVNFGNVSVGTTQNQTGTLSASNATVTVSSLGVSGSQFSVSGLTLPATIAAGNSVSFDLTFAPKTSGTASANLSFASNASNSPLLEVVTGSGIMPQHSVSLGWNTSISSGVAGYNIYRGTASGGPYTRINSALDTAPSDTDSSVQAGQTYYYVVTAVDSAGTESSYSSQAQAVIPTP